MSSSLEFNPNDPRIGRNLGFYSVEEQEIFHNSTVAVAGAGGDGGAIAEELVRLGIGNIRLADPEVFEEDNINRQAFSNKYTIGMNKAEAVGQGLQAIRPDLNLNIFKEGVTPENVDEFVRGADLIIDETEFSMHELGVMIARKAREYGKPVLMAMNVGFGAQVTSFGPHTKTFEEFLGLSKDAGLDDIASCTVPLSRWLARVPSYADLATFSKVAKGEKSAPSVGSGVSLASGIAVVEAAKHLSRSNKRGKPVFAPNVIVADANEILAKVVKRPRLTHYVSLGRMVARNYLNLNPQASY